MADQHVRFLRGWILRGLLGPIKIVPMSKIELGTYCATPPMGLDHLIDLWLADPMCRHLALEMYRASSGTDIDTRAYKARYADRVLKAHLKAAFLRGELVVLPQALSRWGTGALEPESAQVQAASGRAPGQTSWIEIYLRDEKGQPVANEKYRIKLPDGHVEEGKLDGFGHAEYYGINPGTCQLSFPDLDDGDWDFA